MNRVATHDRESYTHVCFRSTFALNRHRPRHLLVTWEQSADRVEILTRAEPIKRKLKLMGMARVQAATHSVDH